MTYIITFLDKSSKLSVYTGGGINGLYCYLEIIGYPIICTTLGQQYHHFVLRIPPTMTQKLSSQLLQLSTLYRILFVNAVE